MAAVPRGSTMPYITDKQNVERLLIPAMMQVIVVVIRRDLGADGIMFDPVIELLAEALKEPIATMPLDRARKIIRRAMRCTKDAMDAISDRLIGEQYLAIAYLTMSLADRDYIVIGPESAFARAWDLMAEIIDAAFGDIDQTRAVDAAAELERRLAVSGFFRAA